MLVEYLSGTPSSHDAHPQQVALLNTLLRTHYNSIPVLGEVDGRRIVSSKYLGCTEVTGWSRRIFEAVVLLAYTDNIWRLGRCATCRRWIVKSKRGLRAQRFCTGRATGTTCTQQYKRSPAFQEREKERLKLWRRAQKEQRAAEIEIARKGTKRGKRR